MKKILLVGESWMSFTTHVKGFDTFFTSVYETGEEYIKRAYEEGGYSFTFMPNHEAMENFPFTLGGLKEYDMLILSDIGANTLLLPQAVFSQSKRTTNRCNLIRDYVLQGGALLMVGGYMTFSGIDGKGKWQDTAVQEVLPVQILPTDDRQEHPEGVYPKTVCDHEIWQNVPETWPPVLGYNKTVLKDEAQLLAEVCGDPFIALGEYGEGRSAVFTSDCAPHWAPPEFINWEGYQPLFQNIAKWLMKD